MFFSSFLILFHRTAATSPRPLDQHLHLSRALESSQPLQKGDIHIVRRKIRVSRADAQNLHRIIRRRVDSRKPYVYQWWLRKGNDVEDNWQ